MGAFPAVKLEESPQDRMERPFPEWRSTDSGASHGAHEPLDLGDLLGHTSREDFAAGLGDDDIVFDPDADIGVLWEQPLCPGREIETRFDCKDHSRLEETPGVPGAIGADVVDIHSQPMASPVHEEAAVGPLFDRFPAIPREESQGEEGIGEHFDGTLVESCPTDAWSNQVDDLLVGMEHRLVDSLLRAGELAIGGKGSGDIATKALVLGSGIDEDEVTLVDPLSVGVVMKNGCVEACPDDRRIGRSGRATFAKSAFDDGFQLVLVHSGSAPFHRRDVPSGPSRGHRFRA